MTDCEYRPIALRIHIVDQHGDRWKTIPAFLISANFAATPESRGRWNLQHIGTGKAVVILGSLERVQEAAAELEAAADFHFQDDASGEESARAKNPATIEIVRRLRFEMAQNDAAQGFLSL